MIKQTIFVTKWIFDDVNLEIYETPFNTFYIRNNITHYVIMPLNREISERMRATLDREIHPFSFEWYSDSDGEIGSHEFEILDLGEFYE